MRRAFDIETTGLTAQDTVTVVGFADHEHYDVYYNSANATVDDVGVIDTYTPDDVSTSVHARQSEPELLQALTNGLSDMRGEAGTGMLMGYNVQGFDFPFLRTRCVRNNVQWPFEKVMFADMQWVFKKRWNTTTVDPSGFNKKPLRQFGEYIGAPVTSDHYKSELVEVVEDHGYDGDDVSTFAAEQGKDVPTRAYRSLDRVYELLCPDGDVDCDPFDDSKEAAVAWADGRIEDVIAHNVADLRKTYALMELVKNYVADTDLKVEKL